MPPEESPEAKFNRLKKRLQDSILKDYPNPTRKGCPSSSVLRELAERPLDRPVEDDRHWHHITHCSECYREFLNFKNTFRSRAKIQRERITWVVAAAAVLLVIGLLFGGKISGVFSKRPQNAELAYARRRIVIPSMERSGAVDEKKPIVLERLPLELTVELPIASKAGNYELQLTRDDKPVISTSGTAGIHDGTTEFTVKMVLSKFQPGKYSIVIRQVSQDWNLYPVVIK